MKPVACGNQVYSTGTLSSPANISAILFSKPSPLSFENGRLAGSAQTRSAARSTRSIRCACGERTDVMSAALNRPASSAAVRLLVTEAGLFLLFGGVGLVDPLGRASARQHAVGARLQVDVDVFEVAAHIGIVAERRHLALLVGGDHLAPGGDDQHELRIGHGLERLHQARRIGRALAVRPVTGVALGMVPAETREGVPIDRTVTGDVVGRAAVGGLPLAVLFLLRPLCHGLQARPEAEGEDENHCDARSSHEQLRRLAVSDRRWTRWKTGAGRARAGRLSYVPATAA